MRELSPFRAGLVSFLSPCSHHPIRLHETQSRHTPKPWQFMGIRAICCSSILNIAIGLTNRNSHYILHPILQAWPQQTSVLVSLGTMHWAFHSTLRKTRAKAAGDPKGLPLLVTLETTTGFIFNPKPRISIFGSFKKI